MGSGLSVPSSKRREGLLDAALSAWTKGELPALRPCVFPLLNGRMRRRLSLLLASLFGFVTGSCANGTWVRWMVP